VKEAAAAAAAEEEEEEATLVARDADDARDMFTDPPATPPPKESDWMSCGARARTAAGLAWTARGVTRTAPPPGVAAPAVSCAADECLAVRWCADDAVRRIAAGRRLGTLPTSPSPSLPAGSAADGAAAGARKGAGCPCWPPLKARAADDGKGTPPPPPPPPPPPSESSRDMLPERVMALRSGRIVST
jgi:hypothetical protein